MENIRPWEKLKDFLPPLASYEQERLKESIKKHGVQHRILILPDDRIIDGVHRWEIAQELNIDCPFTKLELNEDDAFALGISLNIDRRQLSFEQIKVLREKQKEIAFELRKKGKTQEEVAEIVGVPQNTISVWENNDATNIKTDNGCNVPLDLRISIPKKEYPKIYEQYKKGKTQEKIATEYKVSHQRVSKIIKLVEARENKPEPTETPPFPKKRYRCLVIDPPWPIHKIEREERPNQGQELSYPIMTLEEISKLPIGELAYSDGCHVYLWVTHKFLPEGLKLFEKWGVNYQCLLTWVKPTGMTPFSWMYNTEHILFGRIGSLELLKLGTKVSFTAPIEKHSQKPEIFYEIVRQVSPEPRLELFARQPREDFDVWGNEVI